MKKVFTILFLAVACLASTVFSQPLTDAKIEFTTSPPGDLDFYWYEVRIKGIYDADTQTFDFLLGMDIILKDQVVRLWGIDAWELRGPEKPKGVEALAFAKGLLFQSSGETLTPRPIIIRTYDDDKGKYGRWLAEV
jgi:endonuclease YncB( thermonuclease family)